MNPGPGLLLLRRLAARAPRAALLAALAGLLLLSGCATAPRRAPGRTIVEVAPTTLPARIVSNFFLIETRWDDGQTYRFLIDTGSTSTLVTPDLARRFALRQPRGTPPRTVEVRSANGGRIELEAVTLRRIALGDATFERVPALVFDFAELSGHLGLRIDGIIGFPVFRNTLLTLDYPGARLVIAPYPPTFAPPPRQSARVSTIAFNNLQGTPLIPIQMGSESFIVLIDSGSDGSLSLNPVGLHPRFAHGPRIGTLVSSLQGDRRQLTGRLDQLVLIGGHAIERPIVDLTDQLSSIGGEFLRHFTLTFDQRRNQVTFSRQADGAVTMAPRRSTGLSFARSAVYWRVLTVIPDTPTAGLPVQAGDVCVRINGELVEKWTFDRYEALLKSAARITYTFLSGSREVDLEIPVFELVP
ncbi:MAG: aspartyl protease family protein [Opitutaceae bacterium]|nr:aspartyl protease family protein [Opitutaceae bacterium]